MTTSLSSSAWLSAVHRYGSTPIDNGRGGTFQPIKAKDLRFLNELAALDTSYADIGALLEAGKDVRVFSDPHFSHANIIRFCDRPFDDVESMDAALWKAIDAAYKEADLVLCLGDWSLKNPLHVARQMTNRWGDKVLGVIGNHDMRGSRPKQWADVGVRSTLEFSVSKTWLQGHLLDAAVNWSDIPDVVRVGVSHWPVAPIYFPDDTYLCLHGHTHNKTMGALRLNACVETMQYRPVPLQDLFTERCLCDLAEARRTGIRPGTDVEMLHGI